MSARSLLACKAAIKENRISVSSDSFDGIFKLIDKYNLASSEIDELFEWLRSGGTVIEEKVEDPLETFEHGNLLESIKNHVAKHNGIKARELARILGVDKSLVNSLLYANKGKYFTVDESYYWFYENIQEIQQKEQYEINERVKQEKLARDALKFMKDAIVLEDPQSSIIEFFKKHSEFKKYYSCLEDYSRKSLGMSVKELLVKEGILEEATTKEKMQENTEEIKNAIDDIVIRWKGRNKVRTIPEVFDAFPEYKDFAARASGYARKIYGITLQQYLINNGVVEPPAALTDEEILDALEVIKNEYKMLPKESRAADIFQNSRVCYEYSKIINNPRTAKLTKMSVGSYFKKEGLVVDGYRIGDLSLLDGSDYDIANINRRLLQYSIDSLIFKNVVYDKLVDEIESISTEINELVFEDDPVISSFDELQCRSYLRYILDCYETDESFLVKKVNDGTILKILFRIEDLIRLNCSQQ